MAQRFMITHWKGIVIVLILSIKMTMCYTFIAIGSRSMKRLGPLHPGRQTNC